MATLPITVESVTNIGGDSYAVVVVMANNTRQWYVISESLATVDGVRISALAIGQLADLTATPTGGHHRGHQRYDPRTAT